MNREIVITGAGKGLAFCITKLHLEAGDRVYALEYAITPALTALHQAHPDLLTIRVADVSDTESVKHALSDRKASGVPLDIVYNIAGINYTDDRVSITQSDLDRAMRLITVNSIGPLRVLAQTAPLLRSGSVAMTVTSEAGSIGACTRRYEYGYNMSKAAANMGMKVFSNECAGKDIRVFCVHPGWLKTDMGGEEARMSDFSITPEESADALFAIATHPEEIPEDVMYFDFKRNPLPW